LLSFVFSLVTIKFFLRFIRNFSLKIFVIYRVFLGVIILCFAYL
jgi:undecaprenyl-diphosphatase